MTVEKNIEKTDENGTPENVEKKVTKKELYRINLEKYIGEDGEEISPGGGFKFRKTILKRSGEVVEKITKKNDGKTPGPVQKSHDRLVSLLDSDLNRFRKFYPGDTDEGTEFRVWVSGDRLGQYLNEVSKVQGKNEDYVTRMRKVNSL